jgi:hypothetical protein
MYAKTQPPPALDPTKPLPLDEVAQTYARDAARQARRQRDPVELEVDSMFCAGAIVAESERARGTVLSRAVERATRRAGGLS